MPILDVDSSKKTADNFWLIDELFENQNTLENNEEYLLARLASLKERLEELRLSLMSKPSASQSSNRFTQNHEEQLTKIQISIMENRLGEFMQEKAELRIITGQLGSHFNNLLGHKGDSIDFYSFYNRFQELGEQEKNRIHNELLKYTKTWSIEQRISLGNIIARNKGNP